MRKITLIFALVITAITAMGQAPYNLNYGRINMGINSSSLVDIKGQLSLHNVLAGGSGDSVAVFQGGKFRKVPRSQFAPSAVNGYVQLSPSSKQSGSIDINGNVTAFGLTTTNSIQFDNNTSGGTAQSMLYKHAGGYDVLGYNATTRALSWNVAPVSANDILRLSDVGFGKIINANTTGDATTWSGNIYTTVGNNSNLGLLMGYNSLSNQWTYYSPSTVGVAIGINNYQLLSQKGANNGYASLDGSGRVPLSQLPTGTQTYVGTWNASTNTPTLANGSATSSGTYYIVNVAGTQNLGSGSISFALGDNVIYNGSVWEKVANSGGVTSVNGQTAAVVLTTTDIAEGSNLYYTDGRVDANANVSMNTASRHNPVTLGTTNGLSLSGQQLSLANATGSTTGALSATDWNTFNSKGDGTVTNVSSANSNITVSNGTTNPTLTLAPTITSNTSGSADQWNGQSYLSTSLVTSPSLILGYDGSNWRPTGIPLMRNTLSINNVDNTSDLNKPISTATQTALNSKVDKVFGERLINASEITKLSNQSGINTGDQDLTPYALKNGTNSTGIWSINTTGDATSWSGNGYAGALGSNSFTYGMVYSNTDAKWHFATPEQLRTSLDIPTQTSQLTNNSGFITSSALAGYATESFANAKVANNLNPSTTVAPSATAVNGALAIKQNNLTLTTTGTGGTATLSGSTLNIPVIPTNNNQITNGRGYITSSEITSLVSSGTYTPTITDPINATSITTVAGTYTRIGDIVTVYGTVSFNSTSSGSGSLGISLPVGTYFNTQQDLSGHGSASDIDYVVVSANVSSGIGYLQFNTASAGSRVIKYSFQYKISNL